MSHIIIQGCPFNVVASTKGHSNDIIAIVITNSIGTIIFKEHDITTNLAGQLLIENTSCTQKKCYKNNSTKNQLNDALDR